MMKMLMMTGNKEGGTEEEGWTEKRGVTATAFVS